MRLLPTMIGVGCLGVSALAQTTGIPWTPVNLTCAPVTVAVVDSFGNVQGSLVATAGSSGTLWVPIPPGGGLQLGTELLALDTSGTNSNYTVFSNGTNGMTISFISNAPAVSGDSWPQVNWTWFWAGFGMFASFFGFTWALRFTKQIGRVNPEP
jgi:hypothetical protein